MNTRTSTATRTTFGRLLEIAVSLFSAAAGIIHLSVAGQHLDHPLQAAAFLAMAAGQLGLAGWIALGGSRRLLFAAVGGNIAIVSIWALTRMTGIAFVDGLEVPQQVGLADVMATLLEAGVVAAAVVRLAAPERALAIPVARPERGRVGIGACAAMLTVPALLVGHTHSAAHRHDDALAHARTDHVDGPTAHSTTPSHHSSLSYDEAYQALTSHGHNATGSPDGELPHRHARDLAAGVPNGAHGHGGTVAPGATGEHGHDAATKPARAEQRVFALGDGYLAYEPPTPDGTHGAAFRWHGGQADGHHLHSGDCKPTATQQAAAGKIVLDMQRSLRVYDNNPWQALRDGFVAYPIPLTKMFHMVAVGRIYDAHLVEARYVESFMYGMTDRGLTALGGMFMFPERNVTPPNPTGCLLVWHKHRDAEGLVTSFDPRSPGESMWMAHVWTFGGLDPWGRDYDGTEPHTWFFAYRNIPALCMEDGDCL
jgi:hypothetical protein